MDYNKWLKHTFSSGTSPGKDYVEFQNRMRSDLKRMALENKLEIHSFSKNHYEFSAVLKDSKEDRFIYVGISDVRFFVNDWYKNVLIRTMKHDKDWTGYRKPSPVVSESPDGYFRIHRNSPRVRAGRGND